jgi:hypothetical protein
MNANFIPQKVVLKRANSIAFEGGQKKDWFLVTYDNEIQSCLSYLIDSNVAHNVMRDLKKILSCTNRELHQKILKKELVVMVEYSKHIAMYILPSSKIFNHSSWIFKERLSL